MSRSEKPSSEPGLPLVEQPGSLGDLLRATNAELTSGANQAAAWRALQSRLAQKRRGVLRIPALTLVPVVVAFAGLIWGVLLRGPTQPVEIATRLVTPNPPTKPAKPKATEENHVVTEQTALPDGSSLRTTNATTAAWRTTTQGIRIQLEQGQVRCAVAKQKAGQRFVVQAGAYSFVVVGTEFDVSHTQAESRLEVFSGRVEVWRGARRLAVVSAHESWSEEHAPQPSDGVETVPREKASSTLLPAPSAPTSERLPNEAEDCAAWVKQQRLRSAVACYERQAKGDGLAAEVALFELSRLHLSALGNPSAAVHALEQHRARFPSGALKNQAQLALAQALAASGRRDAAASALSPLIARGGPKLSELRLLRGNLHRERGACAEALPDFAAVVGSSPFADEAQFRQAQCLAQLGRHSEALSLIAQYLERPTARFRDAALDLKRRLSQ